MFLSIFISENKNFWSKSFYVNSRQITELEKIIFTGLYLNLPNFTKIYKKLSYVKYYLNHTPVYYSNFKIASSKELYRNQTFKKRVLKKGF